MAHGIGHEAKIGLPYIKHIHHRLAGDPNFFPYDPLACRGSVGEQAQGYLVGIFYGDVGMTAGQGFYRGPPFECSKQGIA